MTTTANSQIYEIEGMTCASCALTLERGVSQLHGVESCTVNYATERMTLTGSAGADDVVHQVRRLGYGVREDEAGDVPTAVTAPPGFFRYMWSRWDTRLALLGAVLVLPGLLVVELGGRESNVVNAFSIAALALAGYPVARSALAAVRINHAININVLMTVAAFGAVLIGAYTEAAMVMVLFALGEGLEGYTASRARHSIRSLMSVVPNEAVRLTRRGDLVEHETVRVSELTIGDHILVKPGERIPMDGRVLEGHSTVNQAPITGESAPLEKVTGDAVYASSVNGEGALEVEVTHLAADNTISRIIEMVQEAQERKAPIARFVDRFARVYTPAVMILALAVATLPPLLLGEPFLNPDAETTGWLYRGLALLVVACPCALVISTPVTIVSAISNGARHGVLFKGGSFIEALSGVKAFAFDKTGTLTRGLPAIVSIQSATCADGVCQECEEVLAIAGAVEQRSEHPLGQAIAAATDARGLARRYAAAVDVRALVGKGVVGEVDGRFITVGSHRYFDENIPHTEAACADAWAAAAKGQTPMLVSADDHYVGMITVADTVRPGSRRAIADLAAAGVEHTVMLTGDNSHTARAIASDLGISDIRAELLPEQKLAAVRELQSLYGQVAMVGDGINDAPALAAADVGIAVSGPATTAQALETADVTLMNGGLQRLPFAYTLSRSAMRTIQFNVALSIVIKLFFLVLVLAGIGTMWMAILADVGTSLLVSLNGMRMLRKRPDDGA